MRILILGGHGFIGSHTSNKLKALGHTIGVIDCYHQYYTFPDWEYIPVLQQRKDLAQADRVWEGKIEDQLLINQVFGEFKPEVVIHVATYPNAKMVHRNPVDAANNMISATANVLLNCTQHQVKRLVFASSSMVYGDFNNSVPNETADCNPLTLYGSYKLQGERMVQIWGRDYNLDYVIMRPSALYGTRDMVVRVISQMAAGALRDGKITVQGPDNRLDFSYVEDVAGYFTEAALNPNAVNQIFNCTRGYGRTILEAAELVQAKLGGDIIVKSHDTFYPNRDTLDSSKIKSMLNYQPQWDIEQGIPTYINWLLEQEFIDQLQDKVQQTS
jgi:nucleoside-diphosphate-sugar epimerase